MSLFYVDPLKDKRITWEELINDLNNKAEVEKYCYNTDFYEIFKIFIASLLNEGTLTVLDGELTTQEIKNLIGEKSGEEINEKEARKYSEIKDKEDLIERTRKTKGGQIVLFTSGTTGKPKAVKHTVENLSRAAIIKEHMQADVWGFAYHPTHIAGIQVLLQALYNGNTIVRLFGLSTNEIESVLTENRVTNISATPTFLRLFLSNGQQISTVRRITSGGEKMDPSLMERLEKKFPNAKFRNIYATTEFGTLFKSSTEGFQIEDELKEWVRVEEGELLVHRSLLGEFETSLLSGEWYKTGDIVEILHQNPFTIKIVGRKNEMVNVGGMKVNITEVEEVIRKVCDVNYVRVYAKQNSVTGNILCCELSLNSKSKKESDIRSTLSKHLQEYKIPRIIKFIEAVDKSDLTRTMKINRVKTS
ncbi:ANL family adenylate-forming protein [Thermaurantimonas aggregans]|uniref:ANL family adenylate-forming protein n=1 Tax=Thermaurantimonas aggregans TaxID=2173829 RepID=UPI0023F0C74F|nr:long-chain fatty acid--CoA ligase [Thermaurantimonas aggregans]MCX8148575.1 long-chain fatty acid--CoA ligase [Thermaurantimonas aggregans]